MSLLERIINCVSVVIQDVMSGFMLISLNAFAGIGLIAMCLLMGFTSLQVDLVDKSEIQLLDWLQSHQIGIDRFYSDTDAADRATAIDPQGLDTEQGKVVSWISKKYRVAPEPIGALVKEAYEQSPKYQIDPLLILSVMAIESNFHPYAQSEYGAQGLMQVVTRIHHAKYKEYGGNWAAFDPKTNLKVGILVLRDCIKLKGSLEGGLRFYVGGSDDNDGGYVQKVLTEYKRLQLASKGIKTPMQGEVLFRDESLEELGEGR